MLNTPVAILQERVEYTHSFYFALYIHRPHYGMHVVYARESTRDSDLFWQTGAWGPKMRLVIPANHCSKSRVAYGLPTLSALLYP